MRILIAEDDDNLRLLLESQTRFLGHEAVVVRNSQRAVDLIEADESFDLIITDVRMPYDGLTLLRKVKTKFPDVPVLVTTIFHDKGQETLQQGACGCLNKPFTFDALRAAIQNCTTSQ